MRRGLFGPSVGLGICCQLAEYGVKLMCSLLLAQLLTQVMNGTLSPIYPWASGTLLLLVVSVGPLFLLRRAYERAVGRDGQRFRETLYAGILSRELEVASRGELEVKLRRDTQAILKFVQRSCPQTVGGTVIWMGSALLLCHTDGRVGLLFFALNLVQLLPILVYETWTKRIHNETCQAEEADSAWLLEGYHGAHVLKCYGAQSWYLARFCKLEQAVMRWGYRAEGAVTVEDVVFKGIDSLLNYGSYVIVGLFVLYGGLSAAKLPLLVLLAGTLFSSVNAVFTWWLDRAEYQAACQRLNWMQREEQEEPPEEPVLLSCAEVEKSFGDKKILSGISLDILRGEHVLLQGKNGSGKSTLLRILLGLERADAGIVLRCSDLAYALQEEAQTTLTVGERADGAAGENAGDGLECPPPPSGGLSIDGMYGPAACPAVWGTAKAVLSGSSAGQEQPTAGVRRAHQSSGPGECGIPRPGATRLPRSATPLLPHGVDSAAVGQNSPHAGRCDR